MVRTLSGPSVGLLVSEFIAAEGMTRDNARTLSMLRYKESERPISIQIFGADVDRMVRAAVMVEEAGADIVDINCGCPAPKVVRRGGGAQLMRTPDRLRAILTGIVRTVSIPVTVKIRSGWDEEGLNALEVARMAEGEGAAMVACHGRTRVQLYSGEADWELVGRIRNALSVPVAGSGDVTTPAEALARLEGGYADAVMIGRAAIDNPWIFAQIDEAAGGPAAPVIGGSARVAALGLFRRELEEAKPERAWRGRYRGLACRFVKGLPGGAAARRAIGAAEDIDAVDRIFSDFVLGRRSGLDLIADVA
jgi:tRNA-dihydrouridine synthase B